MTVPRWPRFVIPAVIIIVVLAILISVTAGIWTDFLWFSSVGKTGVFSTDLHDEVAALPGDRRAS